MCPFLRDYSHHQSREIELARIFRLNSASLLKSFPGQTRRTSHYSLLYFTSSLNPRWGRHLKSKRATVIPQGALRRTTRMCAMRARPPLEDVCGAEVLSRSTCVANNATGERISALFALRPASRSRNSLLLRAVPRVAGG